MSCIGISACRCMSCIKILARRCKAPVVLDITPAKSALSISASKVCSVSRGIELYAFDEIRLYASDEIRLYASDTALYSNIK